MDFYLILGLERGATVRDVKRAYRRLARKFHPGINPGDQASAVYFRRVNEAYDTLSDPERRQRYDTQGEITDLPGSSSSFEFKGFDFSVSAEGSAASTFGDLFADVFTQREIGEAVPEDGADLMIGLTVSFEESVSGVERSVNVTRLSGCTVCHGTGILRMAEGRCAECQGTGNVRWARGHMVFSKNCRECGGSGLKRHRGCGTCNGDGVIPRTETNRACVPPGIADGGRIRIRERGHAGRRGGRPGDLYLTIAVQKHEVFERHGNDLFLVVPIAIHEAALGSKIEIPTFDGRGRVRIPPGTQSGQRFRLRGRGVPSLGSGPQGDLIVEIRLVLPRLGDERSKELLQEFGKLNPENVRKEFDKLY